MSGKLPSGHSYEEVGKEVAKSLEKKFRSCFGGIIVANPGKFYISKSILKYAESIRNFEVRSSDILAIAYPKSGTNWISEIVWNLVQNPDLNNPDADISIDTRCPFIDLDYLFERDGASLFNPDGVFLKTFRRNFPERDPKDGVFLPLASSTPDPRILKDHLPYTFLPEDLLDKAKVIYLARDPREVIVSAYHFMKVFKLASLKGSFEDFVEAFICDMVPLPLGPYWEHMKLHWNKRDHPNFLFLFYEDLKENPMSEIRKIDQFIGTNRNHKQIQNIVNYTSFSNMKEITKLNPPTSFDNSYFDREVLEKGNFFFRKGKVDSWREDLPLRLQKKVNAWMKENLSHFSDDFKYKAQFQE